MATLSPLDIAVIQDKYGVNEAWATAGTFYASIWDAAGVDQIVYDGARDANIDLRRASLACKKGGGWVSYAYGIQGGFTIANGVTVENARTAPAATFSPETTPRTRSRRPPAPTDSAPMTGSTVASAMMFSKAAPAATR